MLTASLRILNPKKKKKKYRESEIEPITSLAPGRIPSRRVVVGREIKPQYKSKPNIENAANQTQGTEVFIKKKKKKSLIHKPKPNLVTHRRSRRCSELVVARLIAPHRRSKIGERKSLCLCSGAQCLPLGAPSSPPSRYFALFLSDSLSVSRSLSH